MSKILIIQSNYIPWKGYFDAINLSDYFVIYDDMQYTKGDWRNRNRIKTAQGTKWLTVPVAMTGKFGQKINETKIADRNWGKAHWSTLTNAYKKSKYFKEFKPLLESFYLSTQEEFLTHVNQQLIELVCQVLEINTRIVRSEDFELLEDRNERLVDICRKLGGTEYYSGPAAKSYMDESLFETAGIKVNFLNYDGYPEYEQLYPPFEHAVSILDLLFNEGPNARKYLKSFQ